MTLAFGGKKVGNLSVGYQVDVDGNTGAAALRIALPVPPGRNGFAPSLSLRYTSGAGNSAFGAGWALSGLPTISLDTRFHVPRWDGSDGYLLGGDELVPWLAADDTPRGFADPAAGWSVAFYRSRRAGSQVRAERWVDMHTGRVHFRTRDAQNVVTIFGARPAAAARIADPEDEARTFAWLPELLLDPHGNIIWLDYAAETLDGVDSSLPWEGRRPSLAQRYLKRARYGNHAPVALNSDVLVGALPGGPRFGFQVVFDYGDHSDPATPKSDPDRAWTARLDPTSVYCTGFEVRTWRLCRRVLAFHDFDELGPGPTLVDTLTLTHDEDPAGSTLREVTRIGYRRDGASIASKALPPLRMSYATATTADAFAAVPAITIENVPEGLSSQRSTFIDLLGEGLPGILTESDRSWFYKPNRGGGEFGAQTLVLERPATLPGSFGFGDVDRDGDTDLSQISGRLAGLFELDRDRAEWSGFRPFSALPRVDAFGPHAQWVDLNGDGRPDVVVPRGGAFVWFESDGEGFRDPVELTLPTGVDAAPTLGADVAVQLFFADMTGDGLADLVRVQNGRVEYWPSLGNGRFGTHVVMDGAPGFATDAMFDPSRLRFVDLDGSGTSDLVYIGEGEVRCYINASGNRWISGPQLVGLPYIDNVSAARVLDFYGDGRACLVWSTPLPGRESAVEVLPLVAAEPPRLLLSVDDSLGCEIQLRWSSSAAHYLRDVASGRGWSTKLPSHHPVVDRKELIDHIGGNRTVTRYEYHDGYYDGVEREFRGFGQVDVYDAEPLSGGDDSAATPTLTRTWYHLGTPMWGLHRPSETYAGDNQLAELPAHVMIGTGELTPDAIEDGLRAIAGRVIRRELYAVAAGDQPAPHPFEITQTSWRLTCSQPAAGSSKPAFSVGKAEEATWVYDQVPNDPRVVHELVIDCDAFDAPLRRVAIGYARRVGQPLDLDAQGKPSLIVSDTSRLHIDTQDRFELAIPVQSRSYELAGIALPPSGVLTREAFTDPAVVAVLVAPQPHHVELSGQQLGARLLTHHESYYWNDARTAPLPLRQVGAPALLHHEESAAFAPGFIADALAGRVDAARLAGLGYALRDDLWWRIEETHVFSSAATFSLRERVERSDGAVTRFHYDVYALALVATDDAVGNTVAAEIDYHALSPWQITDENGNRREVRRDPLGVIVATTHVGHVGDHAWGSDPLASVTPRDLSAPGAIATVLTDPGSFLQGAATWIGYDLDAWSRDGTPTVVVSLDREAWVHDGRGGSPAGAIEVGFAWFDGFGRLLQEKQKVEPGVAVTRNAAGAIDVDAGGHPILGHSDTRFRVSETVIYDGKQRPVRSYQPCFSASAAYESDLASATSVFTLTNYDALGREVSRHLPNGTFARTRHSPWSIEQADENDTVQDSAYRAMREGLPAGDAERQAYEHARAHADTPTHSFLDPVGRRIGGRALGGATADDRSYQARLDVEGATRELIDARGLVAFRYQRDMLGRVFAEAAVDAGASWSLLDPWDRAVTLWNERGFEIERGHDHGDRATYTHVRGGDGPTPLDHRIEEWIYGEALPDATDARSRNLRGRIVTVRDSAGEATIDRHDPEGHALASTRRLRSAIDGEPDWRAAVPLESESFPTQAVYDALGRVTEETLVDGTTRTYEHLASGAVARVRLTTPDGVLTDAAIIDGTNYDADGKRQSLTLGNGVVVSYGYTSDTRRLMSQTAMRGATQLQAIRYTLDPVGNLVRLTDDAQEGPSAILGGVTVPARRDYVYDAHYRLRQATGRVHQALLQYDYVPGAGGTVKGTRHISLDNGAAVERFTQSYDYDAAGNLRSLHHAGTSQSWTRSMWISPTSNRSLPALDPNGIPVTDPEARFDAGGNVRALDHLRAIDWTFRGGLARAVVIDRSATGGTDDGERYSYASDGRRVRKRATRVVNGSTVEVTEKLYLGDSERKRIWLGDALILERWITHVGDGREQVATVHRWTKDDLAREVDSIAVPRIHYQLTTHQGSTALELDANGNLLSYEEYFPYGGTAFIAGNDVREVARKDIRYSADECDDATGLYAYGYRYYAPWMGRWLSPDPIGPEDDLNLYQFVLGDPVGHIDALGLDKYKPGELIYVNRTPPQAADSVEAKIASYRAASRKPYLEGFNSLSHDDQVRLVTTNGVWLVPKDPRAETGTTGWAVIGDVEYKNVWLPARQEWAKNKGTHVVITLSSDNPNSVGGGGGSAKDSGDDKPAPPSGKGAKGDGKGDGSKHNDKKGSGGGGKGDGKGDDGKGSGPGGDDRDRKGNGTGKGAGGDGGSSKTGKGGGRGGGFGLNGEGSDPGEVAGQFGGQRGGRDGGVLGGTPYSPGHTPGGQGDAPDAENVTGGGPGGTQRGNGRSAGSGGGSQPGVGGTGGRGPSGSGRGTSPGHGDGRTTQYSAPGQGTGGGPNRGADPNAGQGPGGAGGRPDGSPDAPTGIKAVLLDIAGMTNFVFSQEPGGDPGGVPGGWGWLNLKGSFVQWLYIATSIISFIDLILGIGELFQGIIAAFKGLYKLGKFLIEGIPALFRLGWRGLARGFEAAVDLFRGAKAWWSARGAAKAIDPLIDTNILINAHKAWRGATAAKYADALALLRSGKYDWVITPTVWKEFCRVPKGGASARRFIKYLESLGHTRVMSGAEAASHAGSAAFRETVTGLQNAIKKALARAPGIETRAGTAAGKSYFNDIIQTAFARASGIPYAADSKFFKFIRDQGKATSAWLKDLIQP